MAVYPRALVALIAILAGGCGQPAAGIAPASIPAVSSARIMPDGGNIKAFAMGLSDRCPSKSETIAVTLVALDSNYAVLSGSYDPPIKLTDSDKSGATHLSPSTITHGGQAVKLTYSGARIGTFNIVPTRGGHSGTGLPITPYGTCVNANPPLLMIHTTGGSESLKLSGTAKPPYTVVTLDRQTGMGCDKYVSAKRVSATSYSVGIGKLLGYGACAVFADSHGSSSQINVLLIK